MKQFKYIVNDPLGLLIRPADMIAKLSREYDGTSITVSCNGKEARATALTRLMGLGVKKGSTVTVIADGAAEDAAISALESLFRSRL